VAAIPDSGHLLQIEHPETVAAIIRDHLRAKGLMGVSS
jgi:pimeloyl-ACP methyl ester carboxylesterase